jgi:hypothetical protein
MYRPGGQHLSMDAQSASADRQRRRVMRMAGWLAIAGLLATFAFAPTARATESAGGDRSVAIRGAR